MNELVDEIRAQAIRFAMSHLASDDDCRVFTIDDPEMPGHMTFILEQAGEPVVLIDLHAEHVLEEAATLCIRPGMVMSAIQRVARTVFLDRHLVGPLQAALARAS